MHGQEHGISDLKGLEYAVNLRTLVATYGKLNDLSPLSGLVHLETLVISNNAIYDISALSNLSALEHLDVHDNHVGTESFGQLDRLAAGLGLADHRAAPVDRKDDTVRSAGRAISER